MATNDGSLPEDPGELRGVVIDVYRNINADRVTAPAAFGVCCTIIRNALGCNLTTAAMLMDCWLTEAGIK